MAVFDQNNIMVPADQAAVRAQELAILQGPGDPVQKAAQVEILYASYGAVPGTFEMASAARARESRIAAAGPSGGFEMGSISSQLTYLKWLVIIFVVLTLYSKVFSPMFPEGAKMINYAVSFTMSWVQYGFHLLFQAFGGDVDVIQPMR